MSHRCHEHVYRAVILPVAGKPHFVAFTFVKALRVPPRHVQRVGGFGPCPHVGGKGNVDRGTFRNSKSMCIDAIRIPHVSVRCCTCFRWGAAFLRRQLLPWRRRRLINVVWFAGLQAPYRASTMVPNVRISLQYINIIWY